MTHTTLGKLLWGGYSYEQEKEWKAIREKATQRWKLREDGDTTRTQEIVHLGQQKVKRV